MTSDDLRRLALGLEDAVEQPYHGRPSFRVDGEVFANLPDEDRAHLMLSSEEIEAAVETYPEQCFGVPWGKRLGALGVWLEKVGEEDLLALLEQAYARRRP